MRLRPAPCARVLHWLLVRGGRRTRLWPPGRRIRRPDTGLPRWPGRASRQDARPGHAGQTGHRPPGRTASPALAHDSTRPARAVYVNWARRAAVTLRVRPEEIVARYSWHGSWHGSPAEPVQ